MAVNQVIYNGEMLVDLAEDTVTAETLAEGVTAHDASGERIVGVAPTDAVRYNAQTLTDAQKTQARANIGAAAESHSHSGYEAAGTAAGLLNRTTAVNADDTNYTTIMARGIGLSATEATPTVNGAIIFQYG